LLQEIFVNTPHFCIAPRRLASYAIPVLSAAALWATVAIAQPTPKPTPNLTPPAAPRTSAAAPTTFKSSLEGYKPYTDEEIVNWKAANDTVAQIGGWRAYAKEAAQTSPAQDPKPASPAKP
jgi:hypothetical protein